MPDRYDFQQTWSWNLQNPPTDHSTGEVEVPPMSGDWRFLGLPTNSCLGIPAGPLLNSDWLLHYARLGFDVLTYKTVRSAARECYPLPNLSPVSTAKLRDGDQTVITSKTMEGDWAVSFGMPSVSPLDWKRDVAKAKSGLAAGQLLIVSIVGEANQCDARDQPSDQQLDSIADDYACCAKMAAEAGADVIEANFSCPNVCSADGQLYQHADQAAVVANRIKAAIQNVPLTVKIGHVQEVKLAANLLRALSPSVQGLCMTNAIAANVKSPSGRQLFDGQARGICGRAIHLASVQQVEMFSRLIQQDNLKMKISAVGGVFDGNDVQRFLNAGAQAVGMATSAMCDPLTAIKIRRHWTRIDSESP